MQLLSLQAQQRESEQIRIRSGDATLRESIAKRDKQKEAIRSLKKGEDVGFFLQTFEAKLTQAEVPWDERTRHLPAVLTACLVESWLGSVPEDVKPDYDRAKAVLMDLHLKPASYYVTEAFAWTKS